MRFLSLTTVCMLPVSASMFAVAPWVQGETQHRNRNGPKQRITHSVRITTMDLSCTLRISSVVRRCFEWIISCRFMSVSWYFWPSCGSLLSLSRTSSSSISCKGPHLLSKLSSIYSLLIHTCHTHTCRVRSHCLSTSAVLTSGSSLHKLMYVLISCCTAGSGVPSQRIYLSH